MSDDPHGDEEAFSYRAHVEQRTVVLPELKIVYLPVPKAACTSLLWRMAALAGIPAERFARSERAMVSPAMLVHDPAVWRSAGRRLADFAGEEREQVLGADGWLRFTVVRDPSSRLWSAWQSKILLRDPPYLRKFAKEEWFPGPPGGPDQVLADFRRFVRVLHAAAEDDPLRDVHWARQHDLVTSLPLDHVGRVEDLPATLDLLDRHLAAHGVEVTAGAQLPQENRTPLGYSPVVYDEPTAGRARDLYAVDLDAYGYPPPTGAPDPAELARWQAAAEAGLDTARELTVRHERIESIHTQWRDADARRRELRSRVVRLRERTQQLTEQLAGSEQRRKALRDDLTTARRSLRASRQRARAQREQIERLRERVTTLTAERDRLRRRLRRVHASASWRVTRPLRSLGSLARRARRWRAAR